MRRNNSSSNKLAAAEQGQKQQHKMPKPQPWFVLLSQRRVALAGAFVAFALLYTLSRQDEAKDDEAIPCDILTHPRWARRRTRSTWSRRRILSSRARRRSRPPRDRPCRALGAAGRPGPRRARGSASVETETIAADRRCRADEYTTFAIRDVVVDTLL